MSLQTTRGRSGLPAADLQELAAIERLLRADGRSEKVVVTAGTTGARIHVWTPAYNQHARGSLTAAVASEVAATSVWGLATIHDPHETDGGMQSMLTLVHDPPEDEGGDA